MALIEQNLFGIVDKVQDAIKLLKAMEPPEGYFLAFSGGKDSMVIKKLADMAGVKYDAHYAVSGIDPPELIQFIKAHYADVVWDRNAVPFLVKMRTSGFPTRANRWCCAKYKEAGGRGRIVMTGVRWAESASRKKWQKVHTCGNMGGKKLVNVIVEWTDEDVWEFIRLHQLPYCSLYDEGFSRLGCIMCPKANIKQRLRDYERWPRFAESYRQAFRALHKYRTAQGKESVSHWKDGDVMFDWWLTDDPIPDDDDDGGLFT